MNEDDDDEGQGINLISYTFDTSPDVMRQPTNLELAVLTSLQSNFQLAQVNLLMLEKDLLADEDDWAAAIAVFNEASQIIVSWWRTLIIDPVAGYDYDDDEEDEDNN